jgi:hypothetical protein
VTDTPDTDPAEALDPTAGWDDRRKAREAQREAEQRRALELLATTRSYSRDPGVVVVQGRWGAFKRNRGTAELRRRKRERWAERWR